MPRYGINVKETLNRTVIVEAEDIYEALEKVNDSYQRSEIVLDAEDYDDTEIVPSPYFGDGSGEVPEGKDVSFYWHLDDEE